jgi:asparagine synthase (glutamine-hydrolysing)
MCGICGFVDKKEKNSDVTLKKMLSVLNHRGPDDDGQELYFFADKVIAFGHKRLSILDLSASGHQPMHFEDLTIVLNGEIYNYIEIKKILMDLGHTFKSTSDTEVVIHSFKQWGSSCVNKFIGMFAFAIFNHSSGDLYLFRDRVGVKPLFYFYNNQTFLFSSELKSLHYHPKFIKEINFAAIDLFMKFGYIPSPYSIFEKTFKLDAGHFLKYNTSTSECQIIKYWSVSDYYNKPKINIDYNDAKNELTNLFYSAFDYRMISDVPVGIFLSGGYDSTAVTSIIRSRSPSNLKTFSIGFEFGNNEAPFAKLIANYLGTDHYEHYCTEIEAKEIIPTLPYYFDEPFADSSAIPTILVSKLARKYITVALSADGGDEIFGGYNHYDIYLKYLHILNHLPGFSYHFVGKFSDIISNIIPSSKPKNKRRLKIISNVLINDRKLIRENLLSGVNQFRSDYFDGRIYLNDFQILKTIYDSCNFEPGIDDLSVALAIDYYMYLQNDILTKVDRATMSVGLEGREPFLDHRILEFTAQLPNSFKITKGIKKYILKDIVHDFIPKDMVSRPKTGFSVPIYKWLQQDLYYLIEDYLNDKFVREVGIFNPCYVAFIKNKFKKNNLYDVVTIWKLLQFHMWASLWFVKKLPNN